MWIGEKLIDEEKWRHEKKSIVPNLHRTNFRGGGGRSSAVYKQANNCTIAQTLKREDKSLRTLKAVRLKIRNKQFSLN